MRKKLSYMMMLIVMAVCLVEDASASPILLGELTNVAEDEVGWDNWTVESALPKIGSVRYVFGMGETVVIGTENSFDLSEAFSFDFKYSDRDKAFYTAMIIYEQSDCSEYGTE